MDFDSEFEFQWHGPMSIFDWAAKVCILALFSLVTCLQCIFCGRWRDLFPAPLRDYAAIDRKAREFRRANAPEPLPKVRSRALTLPLPIASGNSMHEIAVGGQRTDHQSQSFFCSAFPWEIRLMVYEHVILDRGNVLHVLQKEKKLGYWRCRKPENGRPCDWRTPCCPEWLAYKDSWRWVFQTGEKTGYERPLVTDGDILPLLLCCRKIYSEANPHVYAAPLFHFPDPGTIPHFAAQILPHRLASIQRLEIDWEGVHSIFNPDDTHPKFDEEEWAAWINAWDTIAAMQSLKELRVKLKAHRFLHTSQRRIQMCQPMMKITRLRVFELDVEWDDTALRRQVGLLEASNDVPFTIVSPPGTVSHSSSSSS